MYLLICIRRAVILRRGITELQARVDRQVWWYEQNLLSYTCFYDTFKHLNCWYLWADITFTPGVLPIMAKYDLYVILWPMYSFIAHRNGVCLCCYLVIARFVVTGVPPAGRLTPARSPSSRFSAHGRQQHGCADGVRHPWSGFICFAWWN